jgi:hypothetical protein
MSKTIGVVKMLLACKDVDAKKGPEAGITPSRVACEFGHECIVHLLSGCMDHDHDILTRDSYLRDGKDQVFVRGLTVPLKILPRDGDVDLGFVRGPTVPFKIPPRDGEDQGFVRGPKVPFKQNMDMSAVILPVEDNTPARRIIGVVKATKMASI